jgi:leucyl aminopeptidase
MQVSFNSAADPAGARLIARIVEPGKLPEDLERAITEGAKAARFTGKTGQTFEHFVERDGEVVRLWRSLARRWRRNT